MPAVAAAPPPRTTGGGPSPPDPADDLGFPAPFRDPTPAAPPTLFPVAQVGPLSKLLGEDHTPNLKPCHESEGAPDSEDVRTPESSEFFLRELESCDKKFTLAREAFTDEQRVQLHAQILIRGYLTHGRPPKETTMILAFGQPAEGQKHVWEKVWRAALDRCQDLLSPMAGLKTPPSSSLMGSCTVEQGSKDTTVGNSTVSKPLPNLRQDDEKETQGLDVQRPTEVVERNGVEDQTLCGEGSCTAEQDSKDAALGKAIISEPDSRETLSSSPQISAKLEPAEEHPCCDELNVQTGGISPSVCYNEAITQGLSDDANDFSGNTVCEPQSVLDSCLKCGESGQLQRCCGCTLAAHDACFGSAGRFDDGQFYCPVCFYSKAAEAYKNAEKTLSEAKKNLSGFFGWKRFAKQQDEQAAANCKDQGCTSKGQGNHQPEAANLSHQDEETGHEKTHATSDADKESRLVNSPNSAKRGATSLRNMSRRKVSFQENVTAASNSHGKATGRQHQYMHSPARKRFYPYPPECYSTPARSPLAPRRRSFASTARRARLLWTAEEEVALREGVARFAPKDKGQISWVQIREHGDDVFHPTRLLNDLRQKWNYMKKRDEAALQGAGLAGLDPKARRASLPPTWRTGACKDGRV